MSDFENNLKKGDLAYVSLYQWGEWGIKPHMNTKPMEVIIVQPAGRTNGWYSPLKVKKNTKTAKQVRTLYGAKVFATMEEAEDYYRHQVEKHVQHVKGRIKMYSEGVLNMMTKTPGALNEMENRKQMSDILATIT